MSSFRSPTQIEFMCSGGIWSLLSVLLFFLCYEQYAAARYPQNVISLLLSLAFVLRCMWLFSEGDDIADGSVADSTVFKVINRLVFLLLFSALSMLIVMWIHVGVKRESSFHRITRGESCIMPQLHDANTVRTIYYVLLVLNLVIWITISVTTFIQGHSVSNFNILLLAIACFLEAISVFFFWLFTAVQIKRHIDLLVSPCSAARNEESSFTSDAYVFLSKKNKFPQSEVVWQMVIFASVVAAILMARCFVIVYIDFFRKKGPSVVGQVLYPYFYYQIPEFLFTFIIAYGISPQQGLLRRAIRRVRDMLCHPVGNHSLSSTSDNVTKSSSNPMHRVYSSGGNKGIRSFQSSSSLRSSFEISDDNTKSDTFRLKRPIEEQGVDRLGEERSFDGNESCYNVAGRYGLTTPAINPALSSIEEFDGAEEDPQGESKADAKYITAVATRPPAKRPQ